MPKTANSLLKFSATDSILYSTATTKALRPKPGTNVRSCRLRSDGTNKPLTISCRWVAFPGSVTISSVLSRPDAVRLLWFSTISQNPLDMNPEIWQTLHGAKAQAGLLFHISIPGAECRPGGRTGAAFLYPGTPLPPAPGTRPPCATRMHQHTKPRNARLATQRAAGARFTPRPLQLATHATQARSSHLPAQN